MLFGKNKISASIIGLVIFSSMVSGCLAGDNDDDEEAGDWSKLSLDEGGIFAEHPLSYSMDMEFLPNSDLVLISEWPQNDVDPPVVSTWKIDGDVMEKVGYSFLKDRGDVVYSGGSQCGIKLAIVPGETSSVLVFRCMTNTSVSIERYSLDGNGLIVTDSREELANYNTGNNWGSFEHLVGEIEFGNDGYLWVFVGYGNMDNTSQDPMSPFGSVLKMTLEDSGLSPAPNNPHSYNTSWHPMVYSKGLRMPWTAAQDHLGNWWVGEVGEFQYERIQLISKGGQNFGYYKHTWIDEGHENCIACEDLAQPILTYTRDNNHTFMTEDPLSQESFFAAIWVGEQMPNRSYGTDNLSGKIMFGDFTRGFMRLVENNSSGHSDHFSNLIGVVDVEIRNGEVFVLTTGVQVARDLKDPGLWQMVFD